MKKLVDPLFSTCMLCFLRIRPAIVEMKMESNCHALGVICGGLEIKNWRIRPIEQL